MIRKSIDNNPVFIFVLVLFIGSLALSGWLTQENGPWDLFVFIFLTLPINIILLVALIIIIKNHLKNK